MLNDILNNFSIWLKENFLTLNINKTMYAILTLKNYNINKKIYIDGISLVKTNSFKFLVIIIDSKLLFNEHLK